METEDILAQTSTGVLSSQSLGSLQASGSAQALGSIQTLASSQALASISAARCEPSSTKVSCVEQHRAQRVDQSVRRVVKPSPTKVSCVEQATWRTSASMTRIVTAIHASMN